MSSNGIGLQTARGSGTTGHIQKNFASNKDHAGNVDDNSGHFKRRQLSKDRKRKYEKHVSTNKNRYDAKQEIRSHELKRDVEVKCMELRDILEDADEEEVEIEKKVKELRDKLLADQATTKEDNDTDNETISSHKNNEDNPKLGNVKDKCKSPNNDTEVSGFSYKRRYTDSDENGKRLRIRR